jgi:uncharacterized protein
MDRFGALLSQHARIGLDTSIFIYHFEDHPLYAPLTRRLLAAVRDGKLHAVTSTVTIMEIAVQPLALGKRAVADEYEVLLLNFPNLDILDVTVAIARRAAEVRALTRLKPADALHVAAALQAGATLFVTNDKAIHSLSSLTIAYLDDFVR